MLCFLPPIPARWPDGDPASPPAQSSKTVAVLVTLVVLCALIAPIGWAPLSRPHKTGAASAMATPPHVVAGVPALVPRQP